MVAEYDRRRRLMVDGFNRLGLKTFEPKGAFYAFPQVTASGMDDETFCQKSAGRGARGHCAGQLLWTRAARASLRACYATAYEKIEEALRRLEKFMTRYG